MRISDLDFILVPEWLAGPGGGGPDDQHWISRWQRNIQTAQWLQTGNLDAAGALLAQCQAAERPVVVVTHGRAVEVLVDAAEAIREAPVIGAFIVAPAPGQAPSATALPGAVQLAFPSVVVAPDDHPELTAEAAQDLSRRLGSHYVAAGAAGRLDSASGQGPWPEGLMRLGWFLKQLSAH